MEISEHEKKIIKAAIKASLVFGIGIYTNAKEQIHLYGYKWTALHEDFLAECLLQKMEDKNYDTV